MATVLVVYHSNRAPLRKSIEDHLYCFERYGGHDCIYVNAAVRGLPRHLFRGGVDVVIFHTTFLSTRWNKAKFRKYVRRVRRLAALDVPKVAMPQDEFIHTDVLNEFLSSFSVSVVLSCAASSEWATIYPGLQERGVRFETVLTGYLDEATVARIARLAAEEPGRPIDIGYRAWRAEAWLGRHGFLKAELADRVASASGAHGLTTDISTDERATLLGDDWFRFLARCRYTIGVEGGASILDDDGSIRARATEFAADHPGASFDEIEAACFPGKDGDLHLFAISPRHLEACATRTCQLLVEGEYNGILRPGEHYIELSRDLGNLDEVLAGLGDEERRQRMTAKAFEDIVASRRFGYRSFVAFVLDDVLALRPSRARSPRVVAWSRLTDRASWSWVRARQWGKSRIVDRVRALR